MLDKKPYPKTVKIQIMKYGGHTAEELFQKVLIHPKEIIRMFYDIVLTLKHFNDLGFFYRDLKGENILINKVNHNFQLIDFNCIKN